MGKASLVAHVDTVRVPEAIIRSAPEPDFTKTWHPYGHKRVLDCLAAACKKLNLNVERKEYSITKSMTRMFGVWEINSGAYNLVQEEMRFAMGFRNATDKHFAIGLCAGERVFVCDNLVFDSEFVLFRKHSGQLYEDEIELVAAEAMRAVMERFLKLADWHNDMKKTKLADSEAALLTIAAMRQGIIPPQNYPKFHDLYYGNGKESKYRRTLHGWHGATTELYKDLSLLTIQYQNANLNRFIRFEVPELLAKGTKKTLALDFGKLQTQANEDYDLHISNEKDRAREKANEIRREVQAEVKEIRQKKQKAKEIDITELRKDLDPLILSGQAVGWTKKLDCGCEIRPDTSRIIKISRPKKQAQLKKCYGCGSLVIPENGKCPHCGAGV